MKYTVVHVYDKKELEVVLNEYGRGWRLHTIWFNPNPSPLSGWLYVYAKCVFEREDPS